MFRPFALLLVLAWPAVAVELLLSHAPQRAPALPLAGQQVDESIYVFVDPPHEIAYIDFSIDGRPLQFEEFPPWDLTGTDPQGNAYPFDTQDLSEGRHTISANVTLLDGSQVQLNADFNVANQPAALYLSEPVLFLTALNEQGISEEVLLTESSGANLPYTLDYYADWLTISANSEATPDVLTVEADPTGLIPGLYDAEVYIDVPGYAPQILQITFAVGDI
ncbi:hypothetical protein [Ferrimonas pelagia]|uniref:Uncharacterized protein n=1 Tax=Ferrimonas pelagia TaxID=1177826 RepID=A0ABP9F0T1_9GAMM